MHSCYSDYMTTEQERIGHRESAQDIAEIDAIRAIIEAFANLNEGAKARVLKWAIDKYDTRSDRGYRQDSSSKAFEASQGSAGLVAGSDAECGDLASLFGAANPSTASEKALVVGYWFQVKQSQTDLDSFQLHKELKNLGHPVANITRALEDLKAVQPQLIIQTRKSGTAKQARKKYRLTLEGINRVKQMVVATKATTASS